jgi:hypothetical protein
LERARACTLDHSKSVCDIGHVLGMVGVMVVLSMLGDVMRVVVVLLAL